jgi:eukaryotic-like serine/threonine-protein kinase
MSQFPPARPQIEKYELLEELGHGAMATVYRAIDRRLGREVAVKIIHRHLRDEREVGERLAREARAFAKLRHPNIVEVFDVAEPNDPERYLVVEFVRGPTLRQVLRGHSPLPPEIIAAIGIQIADALQHAHGRGVVHRDVKPENVLLSFPWAVAEKFPRRHVAGIVDSAKDELANDTLVGDILSEEVLREISLAEDAFAQHGLEGETRRSDPPAQGRDAEEPGEREVIVKLTDFGIAKVLDAQGVTSTGEVLGSPAHMAPEQIEGKNVGPAADIFALGVLLYEGMSGRLPFEGTNPAQVLRLVLEGQFISPERVCPTIGSMFSGIVCRALAHDPARRYASAAELAQALRVELERAGFAEPSKELCEYFRDREGYERAFVPRIVERLRAEARKARERNQVTVAASLLNRALALRPNDPVLMSEVARVSRLRRYARLARRIALGVGVLFVGVGGVAAVALREPPKVRHRVEARSVPSATAKPIASQLASMGDKVPSVPSLVLSPLPPIVPTRASVRVQSLRPEEPRAGGTRLVQVIVSGAAGSRMLIDGIEQRWFGAQHELSVGEHQFEVIPPNDTCCVAPAPRIVQVQAGEGVLPIHLTVGFREAYIQLSGAEGTTLTCGELFPGVLTAPGRRAVRVSKASTNATCTLLPSPTTGERPRSVGVVLRPGGTFSVSGP